ncbi:hypothetical protein MNBD_NITROSPIRAE01-2294 [hydrothermal vent metagenome]|uniref:Mannosyltransferase n=1 Tax=hydrothermal vent metagenome TaxID=652676 RepID=A0A3B1CSV2_9ZZZZ
MKIGVDATGVFGPKTGIEHYIVHITKHLLEIDHRNEYTIYCRNEIPSELEPRAKNVLFKVLEFRNRKIFQQTHLPIMNTCDKIDLMFFPGNSFSLFCPCKFILTIHDIFPYVIADYLPKYNSDAHIDRVNTYYWKGMSRWGCSKSNKVIAVSESTKNDIVRVFSADHDKISVVHEAVTGSFHPVRNENRLNEFKKKYALPEKYVLCVGTGTHKNVQGSIKAFQKLKKQKRSTLKLIITGSKSNIRNEVLDLIQTTKIQNQVMLWGYFPAKDLNLLFNTAELLLFPSFYEGFGLPVLEAFAVINEIGASS